MQPTERKCICITPPRVPPTQLHKLELVAEGKDREIQEATSKAIAAADAQRVAQMEMREQELTAMLAQAQSSLATMQKLHHASQNQLFAIQSQTEEEQMGRQSELELASAELERAQVGNLAWGLLTEHLLPRFCFTTIPHLLADRAMQCRARNYLLTSRN